MTLPSLGWGHVVAVTVPVVVIQCFLLYADAISGATAGLIDPSPSIDPDEWISLAILLVALIIIKIVILAAADMYDRFVVARRSAAPSTVATDETSPPPEPETAALVRKIDEAIKALSRRELALKALKKAGGAAGDVRRRLNRSSASHVGLEDAPCDANAHPIKPF